MAAKLERESLGVEAQAVQQGGVQVVQVVQVDRVLGELLDGTLDASVCSRGFRFGFLLGRDCVIS